MKKNTNTNHKVIVEEYLFELIERIARFYIHLDEIKQQFGYNSESKVLDKVIFIKSYEDCLNQLIQATIKIYSTKINNEQEYNEILTKIHEGIIILKNLHLKLIHLPRPSEPIELRRFTRIIDKHLLNLKISKNKKSKLNSEKKISIYISENIGEESFREDPLEKFKKDFLTGYFHFEKSDAESLQKKNKATLKKSNNILHISIPRVDSGNPCRWPTLMHEVAHFVMNNLFFKAKDIEKDFLSKLTANQKKIVEKLNQQIDGGIKSWLVECWCDLFAAVVIGPVIWFSQYSTFIFESRKINGPIDYFKHPPSLFRLTLIYRILEHRFENTLFAKLKDSIDVCEKVIEYFDIADGNLGFTQNDEIREIFMYFKEYFFNTFFNKDNTKKLNERLEPLVKYLETIDGNIIENQVKFLEQGLPISSIKIDKNYNTYRERPSNVQEMLLAAWLYRNTTLKNKIYELYSKNIKESSDKYVTDIKEHFVKFDSSILKSIQVSEWFHIFDVNDSVPNSETNKIKLSPSKTSEMLNDLEIFSLIKKEELKIIPIINLNEQLGSTSFDVRLGTSFQLFFPNQYGVIDFTSKVSLADLDKNSKLVDLDFLESITLVPGQFVLGHSMEYIVLPNTMAADLEGRSSFARLGLEIHMTAGFIDPGFEGVLTFEIYNAGPNPVRLFPGFRIAQLRFTRVNTPMKSYNQKKTAKYRGLLSHNNSLQFKDVEVEKIRIASEEMNKEN